MTGVQTCALPIFDLPLFLVCIYMRHVVLQLPLVFFVVHFVFFLLQRPMIKKCFGTTVDLLVVALEFFSVPMCNYEAPI